MSHDDIVNIKGKAALQKQKQEKKQKQKYKQTPENTKQTRTNKTKIQSPNKLAKKPNKNPKKQTQNPPLRRKKGRTFCFRKKVAATVNVTIRGKDNLRKKKGNMEQS